MSSYKIKPQYTTYPYSDIQPKSVVLCKYVLKNPKTVYCSVNSTSSDPVVLPVYNEHFLWSP